jgi:hypothetical protein
VVYDAEAITEKCGYCGKQAERYWHSTPTCWNCWIWYKLERPAAEYWDKAIEHLFNNDLGSGPDPIDFRVWARIGMQEKVIEALNTLTWLQGFYKQEERTRGKKQA